MSYTHFVSISLVAAGVFVLTVRDASAATTLWVCNKGTINISAVVATNQNVSGGLRFAWDDTITVLGWFHIDPGQCKNLHSEALPGRNQQENSVFWVGFQAVNSEGEIATLLLKPDRSATRESFCVEIPGPFERSGARPNERCGPGYHSMEFSMRSWRPGRIATEIGSFTTFNLEPHRTSPMRSFGIFGKDVEAGSSTPAPPAPPAPAAAPKPPTCTSLLFGPAGTHAQRYKEMAAICRREAEQGSATAQNTLGSFYRGGLGVVQSHKQAAEWYGRAAEQGDRHAQYNLGGLYEQGLGVAQDCQQAMAWYRKAATQGHWAAQRKLKQGCAPALPPSPRKPSCGMAALGIGMKTDPNKDAVAACQQEAAQGNVTSQFVLGRIYETGYGVPQDYRQAAAWYVRSASKGYSAAQYRLGLLYEEGRGVERNLQYALGWYKKAADQNHAAAQYAIQRLARD